MGRKYKVAPSKAFDKSTRRDARRGKNLAKLIKVIDLLADGERLPAKYKDHALSSSKKYRDCRECHIEPDWLLVYSIRDEELILLLVETGTHSDLFGK